MKTAMFIFLSLFFLNGAKAQRRLGVVPVAAITGGSDSIRISTSKIEEPTGTDYYKQAEGLEKAGNYNEALTYFGKAAFEFNVLKDYPKYTLALLKMCTMHVNLKRYTEAEQILLNVVIKNYAKTSNKAGLMNAYYQLGKIYLAANKQTQSLWFFTQQGILAQQLKDSPSYIESVIGIANVKIKKKEFKLAIKDLLRAEKLAASIKSVAYKEKIKIARALISGKKA